jgi:hypothetical protein
MHLTDVLDDRGLALSRHALDQGQGRGLRIQQVLGDTPKIDSGERQVSGAANSPRGDVYEQVSQQIRGQVDLPELHPLVGIPMGGDVGDENVLLALLALVKELGAQEGEERVGARKHVHVRGFEPERHQVDPCIQIGSPEAGHVHAVRFRERLKGFLDLISSAAPRRGASPDIGHQDVALAPLVDEALDVVGLPFDLRLQP